MLKELDVSGFRCFDSLRVEGLSRLNLIVGPNGGGKSSLLDWLQIRHSATSMPSREEIILSRAQDAKRWKRAGVDERGRVLEILKLIDERVEELLCSSKAGSWLRVRYAGRTSVFDKARGSGLTHVLRAALTLVAARARSGTALLDDFGDVLHQSVQAPVWRALFDLARDLDVQVFAVTHSVDCVYAFCDVAAESGDGVLLRLGRSARASDRGRPVVTMYDSSDELRIVAARALEVR